MKGGDEYDALCGKNVYNWKPGERKSIKRKFNKRERKAAKLEALRNTGYTS